jgi:hypothetical protein
VRRGRLRGSVQRGIFFFKPRWISWLAGWLAGWGGLGLGLRRPCWLAVGDERSNRLYCFELGVGNSGLCSWLDSGAGLESFG